MNPVVLVILAVAAFVLVAWGLGRMSGRQQRSMDQTAPDLRRADDGDKPFTDYGSPMG